jgi:hypothetical protein
MAYGSKACNWQTPRQREERTVTYKVKSFLGRLVVGAFIATVFGFIALVLLWPFLFGGTLLYVLLHFLRKVW